MKEFLNTSSYFGILLSIVAYIIALSLKKKYKLAILNPLLIAIIITVVVVLISGVSYETYNSSAKYLSYLLTPATICLAIPLYEQIDKLKEISAYFSSAQ